MQSSIVGGCAIAAIVGLGILANGCSGSASTTTATSEEAMHHCKKGEECTQYDAGSTSTSSSSSSGSSGTTTVSCLNGINTVSEGYTMKPGEACIACHAAAGGEAPTFTIAGTVFPTLNQPNDCNGSPNVVVQIVDAKGVVTALTSNSAGNFATNVAITMPYTANVLVNGALVNQMVVPQASGDCNGCHTATGAAGAPGRIAAP